MSQLYYILNSKMSRKFSKKMVEQLLFKSPHRSIERYQRIAPINIPNQIPINADDAYVQAFLGRLQCQFLQTNQFYHSKSKPSKLMRDTIIRQYSHTVQSSEKQKKTDKQKSLLKIIKNLNQKNQSFSLHEQNLQIMSNLTAEESFKHKKYLIYMYKIILNRKSNPEFLAFWEELKVAIITKIYQGHEDTIQKSKISEELKRIQILVKARNSSAEGNSEQAKANYQKLFEDDGIDQNIRMQALQYLCQKSKQKGDESYLLGMISKIKSDNGQERHRKFVENVLNQLHKNRGIQQNHNGSQKPSNQ